jgi:uncharacterized protein YbbC (DUF1343 family)
MLVITIPAPLDIQPMRRISFILLFIYTACSSVTHYELPNKTRSKVITGLEIFINDYASEYRGKKAALVTNQSGVDRDLNTNLSLLEKEGIIIEKILAPEHGLFGFIDWPDSPSAEKKISNEKKIIHMQGLSPQRIRKAVEGCDIVIFDIQDMGMRCYTYISELANVIDALDRQNIELIVLDRPNPLMPYGVDGIMLDPALRTRSTSYFPAPLSYGFTIGEAALYYSSHMKRKLKCTVIEMEGYSRDLFWGETGLPWIPPSPNLPSYKNAVIYSAAVYCEGINISVGRGTPNPFEYIGAPWIDPKQFAADLKAKNIRGFTFRPVYFKPAASKYDGKRCGGVQIFLTGEKFSPLENAYKIISCIRDRNPEFKWQKDSDGEYGIDILSGSDLFRKYIDIHIKYEELLKQTSALRNQFIDSMDDYFLY